METTRPITQVVREIVGLLDGKHRKDFLFQQVLVVIMALAELVGVAAIGPFMALVGNPRVLETNESLAKVYAARVIPHKLALLKSGIFS